MTMQPTGHTMRASPIIAVDSDGTVLDAMTPKHRRAFTPALIDVWEITRGARAASELFLHINLRSRHRGANRFEALGLFLREWSANPDAALPPLDVYFAWLESGAPRSEAALERALEEHPGDGALTRALAWSREVNRRCTALPPPAPFAGAVAALREAAAVARVAVVSGGNGAAIRAEWTHAGLAPLASDFLTQEAGSKTAILHQLAAAQGRARSPSAPLSAAAITAPLPAAAAGASPVVLMLGDSLLDEDAARAAGCAFFPIIPGAEPESWDAFRASALPVFLSGRWTPETAARQHEKFHATLGVQAPRPASHRAP
jgi:phosphoglycolate phosphatase-like HAD superfamily hydrolase